MVIDADALVLQRQPHQQFASRRPALFAVTVAIVTLIRRVGFGIHSRLGFAPCVEFPLRPKFGGLKLALDNLNEFSSLPGFGFSHQAFTKDELQIRPIWHQKQDRVKAPILVLRAPALVALSLAYALWKTLAQWMRGDGLGDAPRTLVEEFAKIKSGDLVLKARRADGRENHLRLRCVAAPDKAQNVLLHRLGLTLPPRLRTLDEIQQM
jgi:hypothetical protein